MESPAAPAPVRPRLRLPRPRLTYANVVASLALLMAMGGTSYAAFHLTGKDITDRSLRGVDIRRNALSGAEIAESTLGPVPRAITADASATARKADTAVSASTAASANRAGSADVADLAGSANSLGGIPAAQYSRGTSQTIVPGATRSTVVTSSDLGAVLQSPTTGADPFASFFQVTTTRTSGQLIVHTSGGGAQPPAMNPGDTGTPLQSTDFPIVVWSPASDATLWADCVSQGSVQHCFTLRIGGAS